MRPSSGWWLIAAVAWFACLAARYPRPDTPGAPPPAWTARRDLPRHHRLAATDLAPRAGRTAAQMPPPTPLLGGYLVKHRLQGAPLERRHVAAQPSLRREPPGSALSLVPIDGRLGPLLDAGVGVVWCRPAPAACADPFEVAFVRVDAAGAYEAAVRIPDARRNEAAALLADTSRQTLIVPGAGSR